MIELEQYRRDEMTSSEEDIQFERFVVNDSYRKRALSQKFRRHHSWRSSHDSSSKLKNQHLRRSVIFHTSDPDVTDSEAETVKERKVRTVDFRRHSSYHPSRPYHHVQRYSGNSSRSSSSTSISSSEAWDDVLCNPPPLEYKPSGRLSPPSLLLPVTASSEERKRIDAMKSHFSNPNIEKTALEETFWTLLRLYNYAEPGILKDKLFVMILSITDEQMKMRSSEPIAGKSPPRSIPVLPPLPPITDIAKFTSSNQNDAVFGNDPSKLEPPVLQASFYQKLVKKSLDEKFPSVYKTLGGTQHAGESDRIRDNPNLADASNPLVVPKPMLPRLDASIFSGIKPGIPTPTTPLQCPPFFTFPPALMDTDNIRRTEPPTADVAPASEPAKPSKLRCEYCHKWYSSRDAFQRHLLTHKGKRTHKCTHCSRSFYDQASYARHIKSHNGEKAHKCEQCNMAFSKRSALEVHMRTHTGERPFVCRYCNKGFSISGNLHRHMLIHTGRRPYKCGKCPRTFNNPSHLARHISSFHA